jgi:toxin ParE1/3/4
VKYRVSWSPSAVRDLDGIWNYYAVSASPDIAARIIYDIEKLADRLAKRPFLGAARSSLRPGLRSARSAPYLIFYSVGSDVVEIERVLHERRDVESQFAFDQVD